MANVALLNPPELSYGTQLEAVEHDVTTIPYGDGQSETFENGLNSEKQRWVLKWVNVSWAHAELVRQFYSDHRSGARSYILWTPFGQASELKWKSQPKSYKATPTSANTWDVSFIIEQVFALD